jgi:hypothetical protein
MFEELLELVLLLVGDEVEEGTNSFALADSWTLTPLCFPALAVVKEEL